MSQEKMVVLSGSQSQWSEVGHGQEGHHDCPVCRDRDLADERARNLSRICLRCLTWTWDPPGWTHPTPPRKPRVKAELLTNPTPPHLPREERSLAHVG